MDDSSCAQAISRIFSGGTYNAYVDATGRPPAGFLRGSLVWLGQYEQCRSLPGAKYCLVDIQTAAVNGTSLDDTSQLSGSTVRWGLCAPESCSETELLQYAPDILQKTVRRLNVALDFQEPDIHCASDVDASLGLCAVVGFLIVLSTLCLLGSILDWFDEKGTNIHTSKGVSGLRALVSCWSVPRNAQRLFDVKEPEVSKSKAADDISCLHGIRVINMCWIVLGHVFLGTYATGNLANPQHVQKYTSSLLWQPIGNAYFAVYTFFFLSGLLVSYLLLSAMKQGGSVSILRLYVHRYVRLTPSMALLMFFWMYVKPHLAEGPLWYTMTSDALCDKYWWSNLLYIQNFYPISAEEQCNGWTWYLAIDTQMYLLAPLVVLALHRSGFGGVLLTLLLMGSSSGVTAWLILRSNIDTNLTGLVLAGNFSEAEKYESIVYGKPYCRIGPYLTGILLGYALHSTPYNSKAREQVQMAVSSLWPLSLAVMAPLLWFWYLRGSIPAAGWLDVLYGSVSPVVWSLALAVFVLACIRGQTGAVGSVLRWRGWAPFSRLTYSVYLIHPLLVFVVCHCRKSAVVLDDLHVLMTFTGVMSMALTFGVVLMLLVDLPVRNLEAYLLHGSEPVREKGD